MKLDIDARLTIAPPPALRISGTTCLATRAGPITLTSRICRHSSGVASMPRRTKTAALLTRMSIRPKARDASAAIRRTLSSSATSVGTNRARPPRPAGPARSGQLVDRPAALDEPAGPAVAVGVGRVERDAHVPVDRGGQVAGRHRPVLDVAAVRLGRPDHLPMPQPAAGQSHRH